MRSAWSRRAAMLLWVLGATACGSDTDTPKDAGGDVPLDCAWLASDNCWRQALTDVAACIPQPNAGMLVSGMLSGDGFSCSYASGTVVTFEESVFSPLDPNAATAMNGDALCYQFERDESEGLVTRLETARGQVLLDSEPPDVAGVFGMTATCPDGGRAHTDDLQAAIEGCTLDSTDYPGSTAGRAGTTGVGLRLANGGGGETVLFDCEQ